MDTVKEDINKFTYYNVDDLSRILHISKRKAYQLMDSEGFPCMKLGRKRLILKTEFERWTIKYAYRKFNY
jgi:excisionase family DNA binding protein